MQHVVLILAPPGEFNAHKIRMAVQHHGHRALTLDSTALGRSYDFTTWSPGRSERILTKEGVSVELERVTGIWTRGVSYAGPQLTLPGTTENLLLSESAHATGFLWERLGDKRWLNPLRSLYGTNRLSQCDLASRAGLQVPNSIVSTIGADLEAFLESNGACIVKAVSQGGASECGPAQITTHRVPPGTSFPVRLPAPVLLQEEVAKAYEIRVAIVGDRVFAGAIDSASSQATSVDSRAWTHTDLTYYRVNLSTDEEAALRDLNRRFGYAYSSMDLIRTPDGRLVFLEANPCGQWTFLESHTGYPIADAMVEYLTS